MSPPPSLELFPQYKNVLQHQFETFFLKLLFDDKHIFTFILYKDYDTPRRSTKIFAYIPGAFWTIRHLTGTLAFKIH